MGNYLSLQIDRSHREHTVNRMNSSFPEVGTIYRKYMSLVMRKPFFVYAKTRTQISCAVTAQLISAFVFASWIEQSLYFLNRNFTPLAILCGCTARLVSDLVGKPEVRFSCVAAHIACAHMRSTKNRNRHQ